MNGDNLGFCVFVAVVGGMAIYVGAIYLWAFKKERDSKSWPKTRGVITHSSIESDLVNVGGGSAVVVRPKIIYEYEVNRKKYTSSQLAITERNTASEDLAREKAEKYSPGQQVDVYYDPRNPSFAILNRQ
jgi:hypothetical protein